MRFKFNWKSHVVEEETPLEVSKSERKRKMHDVQALGEALIALNLDQLEQFELPEPLFSAICLTKRLHGHEAIRRQKQFVGKLMRRVDADVIQMQLQALRVHDQKNLADFYELERWRDRLIQEGKPALTAYLNEHPNVDAQQLRQHIKRAVLELNSDKKDAYRALFQYLKMGLKNNNE